MIIVTIVSNIAIIKSKSFCGEGGGRLWNAKWDVGDGDDSDDSDDDGDGETCEEVVGKAGEGEHCTDSTLPAGKSLILFHLFQLLSDTGLTLGFPIQNICDDDNDRYYPDGQEDPDRATL